MATEDTEVHRLLLLRSMEILSEINPHLPPPEIARRIYGEIMRITGCVDPFAATKRRENEAAFALLPDMRERVNAADDPLMEALRLALAGNAMDHGTGLNVDMEAALRAVEGAEIVPGELAHLRRALGGAKGLLYLGDNAGEIVFDRLLIETIGERFPHIRTTFAVRGGPIINDVTTEDAFQVGMESVAEIVSTGTPAPGVLLKHCSPEFLQAFQEADVVISKGQGNLEALSEERRENLFFLLRVKCTVLSRHLGVPQGSFVLCESQRSGTKADAR